MSGPDVSNLFRILERGHLLEVDGSQSLSLGCECCLLLVVA